MRDGWATEPFSSPGQPEHAEALDRAHAFTWLESLGTRDIPGRAGIEVVVDRLGRTLPEGPTPADEVVDLLASACAPGLTGMPSGRFFGFVIDGTHPAALAADWLTSAWDQNAGLRAVTPAHSAVEELTADWLVDLLGLPGDTTIGFPSGGTMANFTGLTAGRDDVSAGPAGTSPLGGSWGRPGSGCSSASTGTTPSTKRCATSASADRSLSRPTGRGASIPRRWPGA